MYGRGRAWWFVALLCAASLLSVIDRGIINLVVDPLRAELGLSDLQIGALQGLAFGIVYAVGGILLGAWADYRSRRNLVIAGIAVWSLATCAAGLAQGFGQLFAARLIVGLGEAALSPAAASLIADLFEPHRRGRPMGLFLTAQAIAGGLAITLTGLVMTAAAAGDLSVVGLPPGLSPWRATFLLFGACGVVLVFALTTCREPPRGTTERPPNLLAQMRATVRYGAARGRVFVPLYLGFAVCFMAAYGSHGWTPAMLMRAFDFDAAELARFLGPWTMAFAIAGPIAGALIIDPIARRFGDRGRLVFIAGAILLALPSGLAVYAPDGRSAALLVASGSAVYPLVGLGVLTTLQSQWPAGMRGFGVALTGLVNTFIGAVGGPLIVAAITERILGDPALVGVAIAWLVVPCLVVAALLFLIAAGRIGESGGTTAAPSETLPAAVPRLAGRQAP